MKKIASLLIGLLLSSQALVATEAPKYIFYFIGDGMGHGQVMSADTYCRLIDKNKDKLLMLKFPVCSMVTTYSANTPVTDSAAAGFITRIFCVCWKIGTVWPQPVWVFCAWIFPDLGQGWPVRFAVSSSMVGYS